MSMEVLLQNKWIWVCIALLIFEEVLRRLTPKIKGASGEAMVSWVLSHLPKDDYSVAPEAPVRNFEQQLSDKNSSALR